MRRILINATHQQEIRVAISDQTDGRHGKRNVLTDFLIENVGHESIAGNIYKGRVTAVKKDLDAAFIDYGDTREGLLSANRIAPENIDPDLVDAPDNERVSIDDIVQEGQEIIVQVARDPRGTKGSSLNTTVNLQGQHFILKNLPSSVRISRQILGSRRTEIREILGKLNIPKDVGVVVRTSAAGKSLKTLQQDIDEVVSLYNAIQQAAEKHKAPQLLFKDNSMVCRVLRDNLHQSIDEVLVDDRQICDEAKQFVRDFMPDFPGQIRLYANPIPLFSKYNLEPQVRTIFEREVQLPSGGSIVLDQTEALLSIDVNTAKARQHDNFPDMALNTNLEAADEVIRQLRLRDVGGLVVIDFIDVSTNEARKTLENRVSELINQDRTQMKVEPLSRFGLMQIQRRRVRPSILDSSFTPCTKCGGRGYVRSVQSTALGVLREITFNLGNRQVNRVVAQVHESVAAYIRDELQQSLVDIEQRSKKVVEIRTASNIDQAEFEVLTSESREAGKGKEVTSFKYPRTSNGKRNGKHRFDRNKTANPAEIRNAEEAAVVRQTRQSNGRQREQTRTRDVSRQMPSRITKFLVGIASGSSQWFATFFNRLFVVDNAPKKKKPLQAKKQQSKPVEGKNKKQQKGANLQARDTNESQRRNGNGKNKRTDKLQEPRGNTRQRGEKKNSGSAKATNEPKQSNQKERKPRQTKTSTRDGAEANPAKQLQPKQQTTAKSQEEIERSARKPRRTRSKTDPRRSDDARTANQSSETTSLKSPEQGQSGTERVQREAPSPTAPNSTAPEDTKKTNRRRDEPDAVATQLSASADSNVSDNDIAKAEEGHLTKSPANTSDEQAIEKQPDEPFETPVEIPLDAVSDLTVESTGQQEGEITENRQEAKPSSDQVVVEDEASSSDSLESSSTTRALNDPRAAKTQPQRAPAA